MGNAFSDCSGSSPTNALASSQNNNPYESCGYFSENESTHIRHVQEEAREEAMGSATDVNLILNIWRHAHRIAMNNSEMDFTADTNIQRFKIIETFAPRLTLVNYFARVLRQKILHEDDFVEFISKVCSGAHGDRAILDFVWQICSDGKEPSSVEQMIPAKSLVVLCVEIAELAHCMMLDRELEETRNIQRIEVMIESLTNSLLEYANSSKQDFGFEFSGPTASNVSSTEKKNSISKHTFMEWHRKVTPDFLHNSVGRFLQMLFFPPKLHDFKQSDTLFRTYTRIILHSSKELTPRTSSKLKGGEVVPMKSVVFGCNYAPTTNSEFAPTSLFSPEVFALTTISVSKLGDEV